MTLAPFNDTYHDRVGDIIAILLFRRWRAEEAVAGDGFIDAFLVTDHHQDFFLRRRSVDVRTLLSQRSNFVMYYIVRC